MIIKAGMWILVGYLVITTLIGAFTAATTYNVIKDSQKQENSINEQMAHKLGLPVQNK